MENNNENNIKKPRRAPVIKSRSNANRRGAAKNNDKKAVSKSGEKSASELKPNNRQVKRSVRPVKLKIPPVKIIFLGGVGEIGKNMTAIECGDDIIIIDAGAIFPTEETPGFDLIVPDITYLIENKNKVRGLILTHGHEDHIGGVPYLLKELNVPVAGTKLTLALVDNKRARLRLR